MHPNHWKRGVRKNIRKGSGETGIKPTFVQV